VSLNCKTERLVQDEMAEGVVESRTHVDAEVIGACEDTGIERMREQHMAGRLHHPSLVGMDEQWEAKSYADDPQHQPDRHNGRKQQPRGS